MKPINRPSPFVILSTGHGTLIVNRNDYCVNRDGNAYGVGCQLFANSLYDPAEVQILLDLLDTRKAVYGEGVVAVDCGANIGVHTIEWAIHMHGWGEVLALEAQERIYYALAGNIAINNCFNAKALHVAVGAECATLNIPVPDYCKPGSFGSLELRRTECTEFIGQRVDYSQEAGMPIPMVSIDSFGLARLDLIKIDVEGMEMEVLEGAKHSIRTHKPLIFVEWIKTGQEPIVKFLKSNGYEIYQAGDNLLCIHLRDPARVGMERQLRQTRQDSENSDASHLNQDIGQDLQVGVCFG